MKIDQYIRGGLLALVGAILFSTKAIMVKLAYQFDIDTTSLLMLRMLFSLPFFLTIALIKIFQSPQVVDQIRANKGILLFLGLMGYYVASYLDLEGLHYIDASLERIIIFIYPTLVVLISYFWIGQSITINQLIAIVICYFGIIVAYYGNIDTNAHQNIIKGILFVLGSALTYAIYLVGSQKIMANMNSRIYNAIAMSIACLAILIHNALLNGFNLFSFPFEIYIISFLIATVATVIPSFMIVEGIRILGANTSSIIGSIGPISTIILAHYILGERIGPIQWIGTIIVIMGVLYLLLYKRFSSVQ